MVKDLKITVYDIKGHCLVYDQGSEFYIRSGFKLETDKELCMHSLSSLMPYYIPLARGIEASELGISNKEGKGVIQCLDPCEYTNGGTVTFEIEIIE